MTDDEVPLIVVDAANVVGSRPDGWWRDRAGAARRLVDDLSASAGRTTEPTEFVAVLEGAARAGVEAGVVAGVGAGVGAGTAGRVRVVHARGSGDDEIVAVVATATGSGVTRVVTVVTADRELRKRVEALGAITVGPGWLRDRPAPS